MVIPNDLEYNTKAEKFLSFLYLYINQLIKNSGNIIGDHRPEILSQKIDQRRGNDSFDGKKYNSADPEFLYQTFPSGGFFFLCGRFVINLIIFHS